MCSDDARTITAECTGVEIAGCPAAGDAGGHHSVAFVSAGGQRNWRRSCLLLAVSAVLAVSWAGSARAAWTPQLTLPPGQGQSIKDLWAFGETLVAVGRYGTMLTWDGSMWHNMFCAYAEGLFDVWGSSLDDLYVLGAEQVRHWDGQTWTILLSDIAVGDVWGSGPDDVIVVGASGLVQRWDGQRWRAMDAPTESDLTSCWGVSADDFYTVGENNAVFHWDGSIWTDLAPPSISTIPCENIWAAGMDDIVMAGWKRLLHKTNGQWTEIVPRYNLQHVRGTSADDIYAVGDNGLVMHWDGREWTEYDLGESLWLGAVWPDPAGYAYITGQAGLLLRFENGEVTKLSDISPVGFAKVWSTGPANIAVAGVGLGYDVDIYQWDGQEWTTSSTKFSEIKALWGTAPDALYVLTKYNDVQFWDGLAWTNLNCPNRYPSRLSDFWGFGRDDLWVVHRAPETAGSMADILHWDGSSWTIAHSITDEPREGITSIWGTSAADLWIAGEKTVRHWDGAAWMVMSDFCQANDRRIRGDGPGGVFLLSHPRYGSPAYAQVHRWSGSDWELITQAVGASVNDLAPVSPGAVVISGPFRSLAHWDGGVWRSCGHEVPGDVLSLSAAGGDNVLALTAEGLYRWDQEFGPQPSVTLELASVNVQPGEAFWVKGAVNNPTGLMLPRIATFTVLEAAGSYYFWPSWTTSAPDVPGDCLIREYQPGRTDFDPVPDFTWPDGAGSLDGLHFYALLTNISRTAPLGDLVEVEWRYGPAAGGAR